MPSVIGGFNWRKNQVFAKRCELCFGSGGVTRSYKDTLDRLGITDRKSDQAHPRCVIARVYEKKREVKLGSGS